ncbi:DUF6978 family protein [Defluviitalea saccharophila]|uniref:Uncharacterized protein n=1 Tax=Defluviitalea saccharophila TaxID=879970 RepID=A0ABZ2Y5Q0_9FIRM
MKLSDQDFRYLLSLEKEFLEKNIALPKVNTYVTFNIISTNQKEEFFLDIDRRGRIEFHKTKIQNRYIREPLIRLEIDAPPHQNPDGTKTSRNHIHIYKENYGLSWAYDLSSFSKELFCDCNNFANVFTDFCKYCNIKLQSNLQGVI